MQAMTKPVFIVSETCSTSIPLHSAVVLHFGDWGVNTFCCTMLWCILNTSSYRCNGFWCWKCSLFPVRRSKSSSPSWDWPKTIIAPWCLVWRHRHHSAPVWSIMTGALKRLSVKIDWQPLGYELLLNNMFMMLVLGEQIRMRIQYRWDIIL